MVRPALPQSLFDAARLGDPAAIVRMLEAAQPDVRRYARVACRSTEDAEDAAQEALWLLFRRVGTIRSLETFAGWLFQVVHRECLRLARRAGILRQQPIDRADLDRLCTVRPETELRLDLAAAIEALPDHYRQMVLLRDVQEMTIEEIAEALATTHQTVKARLHRARLLIREYLSR